eukprot:4545546-Pyramimonas_sp.AAC.1
MQSYHLTTPKVALRGGVLLAKHDTILRQAVGPTTPSYRGVDAVDAGGGGRGVVARGDLAQRDGHHLDAHRHLWQQGAARER